MVREYRRKGTGSIRYIHGHWLARAPLIDGHRPTVGYFDTYQAETALDAYLESVKKKVA